MRSLNGFTPTQIRPKGKSFFTRFLAGLLIAGQLGWGLPPLVAEPAPQEFSTLRPGIEGNVESGLEEKLRPADSSREEPRGGLEEGSRDPRWQSAHSSIIKALQKHPGGRLTMTELADLANVGERTLGNHGYRSLVAEENARRAGLSPSLRPIEVPGPGRPRESPARIKEESQDPRWQSTHRRIIRALRKHRGGRLRVAQLAKSARVGEKTLYNHGYRSLVAEENARRAGLSPSLPPIEVPGLGRPPGTAAGMEEGWIGLEEIIVRAEEIGFDAQGEDTLQLQNDNVAAVLEYLRGQGVLDLASSSVVNVGSRERVLVLPEQWKTVQNWDPNATLEDQKKAQELRTTIEPINVTWIASAARQRPISPSSYPNMPNVLVLYRMGAFIPIYNRNPAQFYRDLWTIIRPGGVVLIMNPPRSAVGPVTHEIEGMYRNLQAAIRPEGYGRVWAVSPDGTLENALAIAVEKPDVAGIQEGTPGLEEPHPLIQALLRPLQNNFGRVPGHFAVESEEPEAVILRIGFRADDASTVPYAREEKGVAPWRGLLSPGEGNFVRVGLRLIPPESGSGTPSVKVWFSQFVLGGPQASRFVAMTYERRICQILRELPGQWDPPINPADASSRDITQSRSHVWTPPPVVPPAPAPAVTAPGLEEGEEAVEEARERVQALIRRLLEEQEEADPRFRQVAVIGPSYYQERMPYLPDMVEDVLGALRDRIFFDPQDPERRSQWVIRLLEDQQALPTAIFFGSETEFEDFALFMGPAPIGVRHFRTNIVNPVQIIIELLQSLGVSVVKLTREQRKELEQDLALLIQA